MTIYWTMLSDVRDDGSYDVAMRLMIEPGSDTLEGAIAIEGKLFSLRGDWDANFADFDPVGLAATIARFDIRGPALFDPAHYIEVTGLISFGMAKDPANPEGMVAHINFPPADDTEKPHGTTALLTPAGHDSVYMEHHMWLKPDGSSAIAWPK